MKRPGVVWVFCVLITIGILNNLYTGISLISGIGTAIVLGIIMLILEIPWIILLVNFFQLKKKARRWTHISFGSMLLFIILHYILFFTVAGPKGAALLAPPSIFVIVIYAFIWWAVTDYIKKKKVEEQPLFN